MARTCWKHGGPALLVNNSSSVARYAGQPFRAGYILGVMTKDSASGIAGTMDCRGLWEMPAHTGQPFTLGAQLYWTGTTLTVNGKLTTTSTGNLPCGLAYIAKTSSASTGFVILDGNGS